MGVHTKWLSRDLGHGSRPLTPAECLVLFHYLVGYLTDNIDFKQALKVAALEGKL